MVLPAAPLTILPPTQQGSTCTPTLGWRCGLTLPECPHVLHNGLHLQETPEIAILDHALPVDQERPSGMIPPVARGFTVSPNACHTA
jgi:hypothetical protein